MQVDKLGRRYGLLPSQVLEKATTYDLMVLDHGIRFDLYVEQKRKGTWKKPPPKLSPEQMGTMLEKVRKHK